MYIVKMVNIFTMSTGTTFSQCIYVTIATFTVIVTLVIHSDDVH